MGNIIDTDVCIDFLKNQQFAVDLFKEITEKDEYFISILTYYELLKGAYSKKQYNAVIEFAKCIDTIYLDEKIIKTGAKFYRDYRKKRHNTFRYRLPYNGNRKRKKFKNSDKKC